MARWIREAEKCLGVREIKGEKHNPEILQMWKDARLSGIKDDETPWCAGFACAVLERSGIRSPRSAASRSFVDWGVSLGTPIFGCLVVFSRDGGGHVGFVVGRNARGDLMVLGGNQSDEVNVRAFKRDRVLAYVWPEGESPEEFDLPLIEGEYSVRES